MPLLETKGAASAQGFGLTTRTGPPPVYIEDVFSTWLYTGTNAAQTITNGIDLAGKGGLVWTKSRDDILYHVLSDSATGPNNVIRTNSASAAFTYTSVGWSVPVFNTNGYTTSDSGYVTQNVDGFNKFVSWTFRKQPKFFDVVTYTGNNTNNRQISHNLGSVPGCIIVKCVSSNGAWWVYHRSIGFSNSLFLNSTSGLSGTGIISATSSTTFTIPSATDGINDFGATYVAYLFAHNAGGFGLTGTDNVISCGSYTGNGSTTGPSISLGYEPQWLMIKRAVGGTSAWNMYDTMRGMPVPTAPTFVLQANSSGVEYTGPNYFVAPNATGFDITSASSDVNTNGDTYIYIAIRRGPMKTPTTGTSVFNPLARTGTGTNPTVVTTTNNLDLLMSFPRTASPAAYGMCFWDKLRGISPMLQSATTGAEISTNTTRVLQGWRNTGYQAGADFIEGYLNYSGSDYVNYPITRAPGFFDEVCYTGTGSATTFNHNLGVAPELVIVKWRTGATGENWAVMCTTASSSPDRRRLFLDLNAAGGGLNGYFADSSGTPVLPTATQVYIGTNEAVNKSAATYVAYLFASCPGVSKVGSYTGTGALQTINCGFTGGARFVMIKRTNTSGSWFVWDTARGMVAGTDPSLALNSTNAEFNANSVYTTSGGFQILASPAEAINNSGDTYIYLAIA